MTELAEEQVCYPDGYAVPWEPKPPLPEIDCNRCVSPGWCCKNFQINRDFPIGKTVDEMRAWAAANGVGMFAPVCASEYWKTPETERWVFSCTKLGADGRCMIYESRPPVCRDYEPGTDRLCVHARGVDGRPMVPQREANLVPLLRANT